jgi:putative phosphoribosyl transferase
MVALARPLPTSHRCAQRPQPPAGGSGAVEQQGTDTVQVAAWTDRDREVVRVWPDESSRFANRQEAGRVLADRVSGYLRNNGLTDQPLVLGLPPGGMHVAAEIAQATGGELDVIPVARIGVPWRSEFGVGAMAGDGPPVIDQDALARAGLTTTDLLTVIPGGRDELARRMKRYRAGRPAPSVAGRTVIVVDDGMTTSVAARAALRAVHEGGPAHVIFATPVCAAESCDALATEANALVHVYCPCCFSAFGLWYKDLGEVSDDDVARLLGPAPTAVHTG